MNTNSRRRLVFGVAAFFVGLALVALIRLQKPESRPFSPRFSPQPTRLERPVGMAPPAFQAFVRACVGAKIHPFRTTQTIGDHPRSVGYHKQDGVWKGAPYCAATDVDISDLSDAQILRFLEELARQGFAAFWRHEGKWAGGPHIHAIYAQIPMKWQLKNQVSEWANKRRKQRKTPFRWERKWR